MNISIPLTLLAFLTTSDLSLASGQSNTQSGYPFVTHFPPSEYGAMPENWAIAQSGEGLMYFGNITGVLEYDGVTWRLIPASNKSNVRSLAKGEDGRIWVGAVKDLGYLDHDENGRAIFVSIMERLPESERNLKDVWTAHVLDGSHWRRFGASDRRGSL